MYETQDLHYLEVGVRSSLISGEALNMQSALWKSVSWLLGGEGDYGFEASLEGTRVVEE